MSLPEHTDFSSHEIRAARGPATVWRRVARYGPVLVILAATVIVLRVPPQLGHEFIVPEADFPEQVGDWARLPSTDTLPIYSDEGKLDQPILLYETADGLECEIMFAVSRHKDSNVFRRFMSTYEARGYQVKNARQGTFTADLSQGPSLVASYNELTAEEGPPAAAVFYYMTPDETLSSFGAMWWRRAFDRLKGNMPYWAVVYMLFTWEEDRRAVPTEEDFAPLVEAVAETADRLLAQAPDR